MRKYIMLHQPLRDEETGAEWVAGVKYGVTYETESAYYLGLNNGQRVGIDKALQGVRYQIGTIISCS